MARVTFDSLFVQHPDGYLEARQPMRVGGVTIGPKIRFYNTSFGGINFSDPLLRGHDLEIKTDNDIIVVTGIY